MNEASKSRALWGAVEHSVLAGRGIDIGCGPDPVKDDVVRFDLADGDASCITRHVKTQFDFVFSSHCLEHMQDPLSALREWWALVRPGGHLFFIVPDEDLYEQGVFPSRFNDDHKATFTLCKKASWSPVSHNVLDLAAELDGGELVSARLQDHRYDYSRLRHGPRPKAPWMLDKMLKAYRRSRASGWIPSGILGEMLLRHFPVDQTLEPGVLAQIECIVKKKA